jgi:hypothetical protein
MMHDKLDSQSLFPGRGMGFFFYSTAFETALGNEYWRILPWGKEADQSPPSSAEISNGRTCANSINMIHT